MPVAALPEIAPEEDVATVLAVRRAIDELPVSLRDIVTLHELEEHSLRETAELLQIPFDTAKDRLRRAREQLRARLADSDVALARERAHTRRRATASGAAILAGVYATVGEVPDAAAAGASAPSAATASMHGIPTWIAAVAGSLLVVGGFVVGRRTAAPDTPAPPAIAAPTNDEPISASVTVRPEPDPVPVPMVSPHVPPAATVRASRPAPAASPEPVDAGGAIVEARAEVLLLDRARTALLRSMHEAALVTLMAHGRQFPAGDLAEERDVLIIEA